PEITCEPLPKFDSKNLENVRRAFQSATPIFLRQTWLNEEEKNFTATVVQTGWRENSLLVFAELTDADIFNRATRLNQRTWELGDAFEIFLASTQNESYVELHVTPENRHLQLCFPDANSVELARKTGNLENFLIPHDAFFSATWIESENSRWNVYAEIPAALVCGKNGFLENTRWHFSFCRYDHTRGIAEPVISSTSPHAKADFHRRQDWGAIHFKTRSQFSQA
ncbi:MAG TPA: hypothetical protein VFM25_03815, partial [Verrucomicrobiae bacterium]|nr:hypothetical protein [Verrucomicrobiae bacterium]